MVEQRIYRVALVPALAALVLVMFSFQPVPNPLQEPVANPEFEASQTARAARQIVARAPEREPGSTGDRTIAADVRDAFGKVEGGQVAVQDFSSEFRGNDVDLQNVILTIPGESERTILVVAGRDSADGPGAGTSASATAELLTLAETLGSQRHNDTIILASTDGASDGAAGARTLIDSLPRPEDIGAAIVLAQSGVEKPKPPFVISSGTEPESPNAQLVETARALASSSFGQRDNPPGAWVELSRLAFPAGLGEQAVLREAGIEALTLSGHGERTLDPGADQDVSAETIAESGGAALDLILTLDEDSASPDAGPSDYVRIGDNLIPGWTIALLALMLLIAPLLTATDSWLREQRADWRVRRTMPWALERALMPVAALLLAYVLSFIGLIPDPDFPFDPAGFPAGARGPISFIALAAAFALAGLLIRPMRTPLDSQAHVLAAAAGVICGVSLIGIWLLNPYLALLLVPAAHVWMLPARISGPPRWIVVAVAAVLSLAGAFAAFVTVAVQLDLGLSAPWHLLLMVVDGQIGFGACMLWCALIGGLIACVSATAARRIELPSSAPRLRGAGTHIGPGALGSTPAADSRHR
jgi:hypothetical protein